MGRLTYFLCTSAVLLTLLLSSPTAVQAQGSGYWHTSGNLILDGNGQAIRIAGINWYGFETTNGVANGLSTQDYKTVLRTVRALGYNTIRIPLSNEVVERPLAQLNISYWYNHEAINTDLRGLNSLQVLDRIVDYAGTQGLKVILDNHRSAAGSGAEPSGLWYSADYPESSWIRDWVTLARRYRNNPTVIGFDLRNEPHNAMSGGACWDCSGPRDWHLAAERAGNAIQAVNWRVLIFVEGTDAYNNDYYWWGGNLEGVATSPVVLSTPNQLVYSAHDYGPHEHRQPWFNAATTKVRLEGVWNRHWAYISRRNIAPVWLGEFGTPNSDPDLESKAPGSQGQWFEGLVEFLGSNSEIHWTYWALNGEDSYGLLNEHYSPAPVNPLKRASLARIQFRLAVYAETQIAPVIPSTIAQPLEADAILVPTGSSAEAEEMAVHQ